jgi:hypothetical protein
MANIDIYYQGEGLRGIQHLEVHPDSSLGEVKVMLIEKHGLPADILIFLEDAEDPADEASAIHAHKGKAGVKLHVHRSRKIEVTVTYNGRTVEHHFGPGTTIAHVKRWAAEREFGMSAEDAGEHLLQIVGTQDRPALGVHLGALVETPTCRIAFDLVPDQRVNGSQGDFQ